MLVAVIFGGTITENKQTKKDPLFLKTRALKIFKGKTWSRRWVKTIFTGLSDPQKVLRRALTKGKSCSSPWSFPYQLPSFSSVDQNWKCKCLLYTHPPWKERASPFHITCLFLSRLGQYCIFITTLKTLCLRPAFLAVLKWVQDPSCLPGDLEHRYLIVNYKAEYFILLFFCWSSTFIMVHCSH